MKHKRMFIDDNFKQDIFKQLERKFSTNKGDTDFIISKKEYYKIKKEENENNNNTTGE